MSDKEIIATLEKTNEDLEKENKELKDKLRELDEELQDKRDAFNEIERIAVRNQ